MSDPQVQAALGLVAAFTSMLEHDNEDDMAAAGVEQFNAAMESLSQQDVILGISRFAIFLLFDHRDRSGDLPEDILQRVALRLAGEIR